MNEALSSENPTPSTFGDEVAICGRLQKLAPQYHSTTEALVIGQQEAEALRQELAYEFSFLKAIHIGKGRDSNWGPLVKDLGFKVRTVDRWVANMLASGELPPEVAQKLREGQDVPASQPAPSKDEPLSILLNLTGEDKATFLAAAKKLGDRLTAVIFEAVTQAKITPARAFVDEDEEPVIPLFGGAEQAMEVSA
jgi:hypothetical protein